VRAGVTPGVDEGAARLAVIRRDGPGPRAFDFKQPFGPGGEPLDAAALRVLPAACG